MEEENVWSPRQLGLSMKRNYLVHTPMILPAFSAYYFSVKLKNGDAFESDKVTREDALEIFEIDENKIDNYMYYYRRYLDFEPCFTLLTLTNGDAAKQENKVVSILIDGNSLDFNYREVADSCVVWEYF